MDPRRSLRALRRRAWLVAGLPVLAAAVAAAVSLALPPVYQAEVAVLVRPAQPINSLDPNASAVSSDEVASTYSHLMTQRALLDRVIADLDLHLTAAQLSRSVSVSPQFNTTLLQVSVRNSSPKVARDIANRLVDDFIAQTKDIQQNQVNQYAARIQTQIQQLRDQIQREQSRIDQLQAAAGSGHALSASDQTELTGLQQQITADRSQYFQILSSESDIEINVARSMDSVIVISPAVLPASPVSPVPLLNAGLAFLAGLVVAVGGVLLLDYLDQTIKTDAELAERTGLLALAHVPLATKRRRPEERLAAMSDDPSAAEPYRTLRTNVLFSTLDKQRFTIMVTSASPEEGKSVVSANFAAALAAAGHRTLLVDCDFRRPSQHRLFGRIRNVGVSDLLLGQVAEADVILPLERVPGLWLVTSGRIPPNPSELLSSERMRDLLRRLQDRFEYVVIDTPPVNAVADPLIVGSYADATLFIVEQRRTSYAAARNGVEALERVGAHVIGAVVNKVVTPETHYEHYYRYGYGPDAEEPAPAAVPAPASNGREPVGAGDVSSAPRA